jgi:hypothetical protein
MAGLVVRMPDWATPLIVSPWRHVQSGTEIRMRALVRRRCSVWVWCWLQVHRRSEGHMAVGVCSKFCKLMACCWLGCVAVTAACHLTVPPCDLLCFIAVLMQHAGPHGHAHVHQATYTEVTWTLVGAPRVSMQWTGQRCSATPVTNLELHCKRTGCGCRVAVIS